MSATLYLCLLVNLMLEGVESSIFKWNPRLLNQLDLNPFRANSAVVTISNGQLMGASDSKSEAFMGVPFALAPVGSLRFMRPVSIADVRWTGVKSARKVKPMCVQRSGLFPSTPIVGSEDCLYLNVFRPKKTTLDSNLPVMVFIPGGAFSIGGSYWINGQSDGSTLAVEQNVIVVVLSYRLNLLGFLASEQLMHANGGSVGNLALQDQQEGLRWVKREIRSFGGDPDRVVLFGESAGGFSVMWHSVSVASREEGLFSSVIAQSGSSDLSWFFQKKNQAFQLYASFTDFLGCPDTNTDQLGCLQALPAESFLKSWTHWSEKILSENSHADSPPEIPMLHLVSAFGPVIDGHDHGLLDVPYRLIERGLFHKVPLLAGVTRDEGSVFSWMIPRVAPSLVKKSHSWVTSPEHWMELLELIVQQPEAIRQLHALYPLLKLGGPISHFRWASEIIRDFVFACSTEETVLNWGLHAPAHLYLFSGTLGWLGKLSGLGALHSLDVFYVFKTFPLMQDRDLRVSSEIGARWASMARSGTPNPPGVVEWPEYISSGVFIEFAGGHSNQTSSFIQRETADKETWPSAAKCQVWHALRPLPWIPLSRIHPLTTT